MLEWTVSFFVVLVLIAVGATVVVALQHRVVPLRKIHQIQQNTIQVDGVISKQKEVEIVWQERWH